MKHRLKNIYEQSLRCLALLLPWTCRVAVFEPDPFARARIFTMPFPFVLHQGGGGWLWWGHTLVPGKTEEILEPPRPEFGVCCGSFWLFAADPVSCSYNAFAEGHWEFIACFSQDESVLASKLSYSSPQDSWGWWTPGHRQLELAKLGWHHGNPQGQGNSQCHPLALGQSLPTSNRSQTSASFDFDGNMSVHFSLRDSDLTCRLIDPG